MCILEVYRILTCTPPRHVYPGHRHMTTQKAQSPALNTDIINLCSVSSMGVWEIGCVFREQCCIPLLGVGTGMSIGEHGKVRYGNKVKTSSVTSTLMQRRAFLVQFGLFDYRHGDCSGSQ